MPTQALDASNLSEDGMSERVRFDNVCYVIDGRKQSSGSDAELSADKASVGSCRSFRSSDRSFRDDVGDSASLSSLHKRIMNVQQRLAKSQQQLRINAAADAGTASASRRQATDPASAAATPEAAIEPATPPTATAPAPSQSTSQTRCSSNDRLSAAGSPPPAVLESAHGSPTSQTSFVSSGSGGGEAVAKCPAASSGAPTTTKAMSTKNMSKVAILRNLFFSQHPDGGGSGSSDGDSNGDCKQSAHD